MRSLLEKALDEVKKANAQGDLIFNSSKSLKLSAFGKELTEYKVSGSQVLGLRLIKDNRVGIAYTESLDDDSLIHLVRAALTNASASSVNQYEEIAYNEGELHDEEISAQPQVDVEEKVAKVTGLLESFKMSDSRVESLPYNGYAENVNMNMYLNSHGRFVTRQDQFFQSWAMPMLVENGKKATYYDSIIASSYQHLSWDRLREETIQTSAALLNTIHLKTAKYQVEFIPDCLGEFFGRFSSLFSAKSVINKMNPWQKMLGQKVIHDSLTLTDDTHFKDAFSHYQCDGEGFLHKKINLIENGVLKTFLHNSATAKELGHENTFHAIRGAGSPLGISRTNFILNANGTQNFSDTYVEIIQLDGLSSGSNDVTGDFSCGAKGFLHQNGEKIAFADATLSGNFFEMLKNLSVVDKSLSANNGRSLFVPRIIFHDLSIAGQGV